MSRGLMVRWVCALAVVAAGITAQAQDRVHFDSLDHAGGKPVALLGFWFAASLPRAPAVVLLHGCGGTYGRRGELSERTADYVAFFNAQGMHALVLDSLTPRAQKELCTQRLGERSITMTNRRLDALAAIEWLAQRPEVDPGRIGLIGWSNGGSTVLAGINSRHPVVAAARRPAFAIAFYPGCESELKRGFETSTRLLVLVGESDDWTPAAPCRELAQHSAGVPMQFEAYAGAFHGFDSGAPVRLRKDVPNGVNPGQGVHVGGQPQARVAARVRLQRFLAELPPV